MHIVSVLYELFRGRTIFKNSVIEYHQCMYIPMDKKAPPSRDLRITKRPLDSYDSVIKKWYFYDTGLDTVDPYYSDKEEDFLKFANIFLKEEFDFDSELQRERYEIFKNFVDSLKLERSLKAEKNSDIL